MVGDLPGDEVAAVVVGVEVDVVVPAGAVALEEVLDAPIGADPGWVLVADEGDTAGRLDGRLPVVGRGPGVAVVVGVGADRGLEAPLSSSRRREGRCISRVSSGVIGPHAADYDVGKMPFVGAAGFPLGLMLGTLAVDVVAGGRIAADLGDVHQVQDGVHLPVAGQVEAVVVGA